MGVLLEARGLIKYFPIKKSFRQFFKPAEPDRVVKAVDDVSFILDRGKVLVFAGASGSGKTTVAERLAELAGERPHLALVKLDSYYVDLSDRPLAEREAFNFDHPDAFDWPLLNDHLAALVAGAPVPVPIYD